MRDNFVFWLDIDIHNELHNHIIHDIPKPSAGAILSILQAFQDQIDIIDQMDIVEAAEWLAAACDEEPFHACMQHQANFLREKLRK